MENGVIPPFINCYSAIYSPGGYSLLNRGGKGDNSQFKVDGLAGVMRVEHTRTNACCFSMDLFDQ